MKKSLFAIFLLSFFFCSAQQKSDNQYYLGVNTGINTSRANFELTREGLFNLSAAIDYELNFNYGLVFLYFSEPGKGVQMELNYSKRGYTQQTNSTDLYSKQLSYIEFPFLSHFDFNLRKINFAFTLGPTISYIINTQEATFNKSTNQAKEYIKVANENKMEAGLCLGLGVNMPITKGIIQIESRLNHGIGNLFSGDNNNDITTSQYQVYTLKIAYLFKL